VCCGVLQCAAVCCSVLQCDAGDIRLLGMHYIWFLRLWIVLCCSMNAKHDSFMCYM